MRLIQSFRSYFGAISGVSRVGSLFCALVLCTPIGAAEPTFEAEFSAEKDGAQAIYKRPATVLPRLATSSSDSPVTTNGLSISSITLSDNSVLEPAEVDSTIAPYLNRVLTAEDLQTLQQQLTGLYIGNGYLNSGVVLPEQQIRNGQIEFRAIEGRLSSIQTNSNSLGLGKFAEREIQRELSGPLSLSALETGIRKLELDPLVRRVSGRLLPGGKPGESRLMLAVEENHPLRVSATFDNFEAPTVGANRGTLRLNHMNLTGRRDQLSASFSATDGLRDGLVSYRLPFLRERFAVSAYYAVGTSEIIESPFDELDIEADNTSGGLSLEYRLINRLNRKVSLSTGLLYSSSETELLDESFSFARGAIDGRSTSTSALLEFEWVERWDRQLLALRTSIRHGFDGFDATIIPQGGFDRDPFSGARTPESRFQIFLTQLQWAKGLDYANSELVVNAAWQRTPDPLLSVDKFAIGGNATVRGFRENSLLRDNGFYTNVEWRVPLFRQSRWSRLNLMAIPFFDYAQANDQGDRLPTSTSSTLSSVGLTVRARPTQRLFMQLTYGERLRSESVVSPRDRGLQDHGIHLAVNYQWSPRR